MRRILLIVGALAFLLPLIPYGSVAAASSFASPAFQQQWQRAEAGFPNFFGPLALAKDGTQEPYKEATGGQRLVQYFDKARMELTNGALTNGLLTVELKSGRLQTGDNQFEQRSPARINIAGDPGSNSVTYADLNQLPERDSQDMHPPLSFIGGQLLPVQNIPIPNVSFNPNSFYGPYVQDPSGRYGQYVFKPFYEFINAVPQGQAVIGYPISPVVVTEVRIGGVPMFVLVQAFERRVLTLNGTNPPSSRLEFGNIGQHYYQWRYQTKA